MRWSIASLAGLSLLVSTVTRAESSLIDMAPPVVPIEEWGAPGCGSMHQPERDAHPPNSCLPNEILLGALALWVTRALELPAVTQLPAISFASPGGLVATRLSASRSQGAGAAISSIVTDDAPDIAALYDDRSQTIHLHERWTGETPTEVSILVHEMVHHVQNVSGLRYPCPEAREEPAYTVQGQWLELFGKNLENEFSLDPMTLMVRTRCWF